MYVSMCIDVYVPVRIEFRYADPDVRSRYHDNDDRVIDVAPMRNARPFFHSYLISIRRRPLSLLLSRCNWTLIKFLFPRISTRSLC